MITLYDCSTAPSPRRARILLAEKGVAHDTVQVDLRNGEQLGEAYRQINPQCTVPALRTEEGLLLTDNAAITAYVEARYPQPALLGETPAEKAEIASWNWRMEFEGLLAIAVFYSAFSVGFFVRERMAALTGTSCGHGMEKTCAGLLMASTQWPSASRKPPAGTV